MVRLTAARRAGEPHRDKAHDRQHEQYRLEDVEGGGDPDDQENAAREPDRRAGDSHHPPHGVHRAAEQVLELGGLEALEIDRDDPVEQHRVGVPFDDGAEELLLLALHQPGGARDQAQPDRRREEGADAAQVAAAAGREHRGDQVARDDELRPGDHRADQLRREARDEAARCRCPDKPERRREHAWNPAELPPLGRSLHRSAAASPEDGQVSNVRRARGYVVGGTRICRVPRTSMTVPRGVCAIRTMTPLQARQRSTTPGARV